MCCVLNLVQIQNTLNVGDKTPTPIHRLCLFCKNLRRLAPGEGAIHIMVNKDKNYATEGYMITEGKIGFLNYRNKIFKEVSIHDVVEKFYDEIEEMAETV